MRTRRRKAFVGAALSALVLLLSPAGPVRSEEDVAEPVGKVLTLPEAPEPHWFWLSDVMLHRTALFDGDSGKLLGSITAGSPGVGFVIQPHFSRTRKEIYIAESYFSRGIRGERTDVVTIYDVRTLMPVTEISIPPKRAEYFPGVAASALSFDERYLAVVNVTPAQSLTIVNVAERRFVAEVQTPGCGLVYPASARRFFMLCADGAALLVDVSEDGASAAATRTAKFFDADKDPLMDKAARVGREWYFTSFEGMVHAIDVTSEPPRFADAWPLFDENDRKESWRIGGGQQLAIHLETAKLFALVHQGGPDTHKQAGTEIWVYEIGSKRRVQRFPVQNPLSSFVRLQMKLGQDAWSDRTLSWLLESSLPNFGAEGILVTQDEAPRLVSLSQMPPAVTVYDAKTGAVVREVSEPGIAGSLLTNP